MLQGGNGLCFGSFLARKANKSESAEQGGETKSQAANKEGAQGSSGEEGGARGGPREARGTLRRQTRATSTGHGAIPAMRAGTPDRARPTQAPPPDRGGRGPRQDHPRFLRPVRYAGKEVQPRRQQSTYSQRTVNAQSTHSQRETKRA